MIDRLSLDDFDDYNGGFTNLSTFSTFITGLSKRSSTIHVHQHGENGISGRLVIKILSVWSHDDGQNNTDNAPPVPWLAFKCADAGQVHYLLAIKHHGCSCNGMPRDNILIRKLAGCGYGSLESDAIQALDNGIASLYRTNQL